MSGLVKANFGKFEDVSLKELSDEEYFKELNSVFKGSVLQEYFLKLKSKEIKISYKPQHILQISQSFDGRVIDLLKNVGDEESILKLSKDLFLDKVLNRDVKNLSGGELQRVAVMATLLKKDSTFLVFDEISNYLDVFQRLNTSRVILDQTKEKTALVVEHDLVVLDYLSDYIHIQYGEPGAYGVLTGVKGAKNGINDYLAGYSKEENVRFRDKPITFEKDSVYESKKIDVLASWREARVDLGEFSLDVSSGEIKRGEVLGIVGKNGLGKSTLVNYIAKNGFEEEAKISYKPQIIDVNDNLVLAELAVFPSFKSNFYQLNVIEPLKINDLLEKQIDQLSGGELQRFAIARCLLDDADIYLLDEPTAFLDVEDRLRIAKMLKSFMEVEKRSAMIIDHDLVFMDYMSDRLLVFEGEPSVSGRSLSPMSMRDGMNLFLKDLGITFRRDVFNKRPRVNKLGSVKDIDQKRSGEYYYV